MVSWICVESESSSTGDILSNICLPMLEIEGVGMIGCPLFPLQAQKIISVCEQAPYGRKEKTIVDLKVRNTWQLAPSEFKILNHK